MKKNYQIPTIRFFTILFSAALLVSCAKKTEDLVTPEPPPQEQPSEDTDRLAVTTEDPEMTFDTAEDTVEVVEVDTTTEIVAEVEPADTMEVVEEAAPEEEPLPEELPVEEPPAQAELTVTPEHPKPEVVLADSVFEDYMIKRGDFLSKIAKQEYGDWLMWKQIYRWNREEIGENPNLIYPYHFLDLLKPAGEAKNCPVEFYDYTVAEGQTLWSIAGTVFGNELAWIILYMDNEDVLEGNAGVLKPGMVIKLRQKLDPCS